jgi:hypothetical protein
MPINITQLGAMNALGRSVIYRDSGKTEDGVITSWNERYVFVKYGTLQASQATSPECLEWAVSSIDYPEDFGWVDRVNRRALVEYLMVVKGFEPWVDF